MATKAPLKLYRALVRVMGVEDDPKFLRVFVPAATPCQDGRVLAASLPESVRKAGARLFAQATLDATDLTEMRIEGPFEVAKSPDSDDGLA